MNEWAETLTVPDGITPIRAARAWDVRSEDVDLRLRSIVKQLEWPAPGGLVEAKCLKEPEERLLIDDPDRLKELLPELAEDGEDGGIWINNVSDLADLVRDGTIPAEVATLDRVTPCEEAPHSGCKCGIWGLVNPSDLPVEQVFATVVGIVEMWGRVVPGTKGWRSQFAQVVALKRGPLTGTLAGLYDVPLFSSWPELTPPIARRELPWTSEKRKRSSPSSQPPSRIVVPIPTSPTLQPLFRLSQSASRRRARRWHRLFAAVEAFLSAVNLTLFLIQGHWWSLVAALFMWLLCAVELWRVRQLREDST